MTKKVLFTFYLSFRQGARIHDGLLKETRSEASSRYVHTMVTATRVSIVMQRGSVRSELRKNGGSISNCRTTFLTAENLGIGELAIIS